MNGTMLIGWNADCVAGSTITVNVANKYNYTATDAAAPTHTYTTTVVQVLTFNATKTATRITDLDATIADDEFRIVTGEVDEATTDRPGVFRKTWALTQGDADDVYSLAASHMQWIALPFTYTRDTTYVGPGAPPDDHYNGSGTGDLIVTFDRTNPDVMTWVVLAPVQSFSDVGTADPITFKKGGSDNFGFTQTITTTNPGTIGGLTVTAWDVTSTCTVTVS
jgi:hypothetical protein